jgi:hypothetical protein
LFWGSYSADSGQSQDLSSKYYYLNTYEHFLEIVNLALLKANDALRVAYNTAAGSTVYPAGTPGPNVYLTTWNTAFPAPQMEYTPTSGLFNILYNPYYQTNPTAPVQGPVGNNSVSQHLFFNSNMEGLFANFNATYYNIGPTINPPWLYPPLGFVPWGYGYSWKIQCLISPSGDNLVASKTLPATSPFTPASGPTQISMTQDYCSTTTLWSPIENITFTSTLLPLQNEQVAPPNALGTRNTGISAATSASAFTPIITDVALPLTAPEGAAAYRQQIYYAPQAEYRMADFQNSKQEIRNVDVQVFWKNRLDNQLYPLSMYNLSSVSIKIMFRKKAISLEKGY